MRKPARAKKVRRTETTEVFGVPVSPATIMLLDAVRTAYGVVAKMEGAAKPADRPLSQDFILDALKGRTSPLPRPLGLFQTPPTSQVQVVHTGERTYMKVDAALDQPLLTEGPQPDDESKTIVIDVDVVEDRSKT